MKKVLGFALLVLALTTLASTASAHRFDKEQEGHPLRYIGYVGNVVGVAAEWVVARPIHFLVSLPVADVIFGHKSYVADDKTYFEFVHGDWSPSVMVERGNQ